MLWFGDSYIMFHVGKPQQVITFDLTLQFQVTLEFRPQKIKGVTILVEESFAQFWVA